ncbi:hypothetical protein K439DRAFT_179946 [Ramaria rubella]|nr:hypothetical protein K439DRAFT_179946 [Ramaria rubella]
MMTKVGRSDAGQTGASKIMKTTTATKRKSGTVVSVNRSQNDDIFEDDTGPALSGETVDLDDIYDFGSSPLRPNAAIPGRSLNHRRTNDSDILQGSRKHPGQGLDDSGDMSQQCYKALLSLRDEITQEQNSSSAEKILEESLLQIISAILPTDVASFKEVLNENLPKEDAASIWNTYGKRILEVCTSCKMSSSSRASKSKFDMIELHAQFDFHASASSSNSSSGNRTTVKRRASSMGSTKVRSIRAMPL